MFGYCGDVVFPSIVLSQFVAALDGRLQSGQSKHRFGALERLVRVSFSGVPHAWQREFQIIHCGRDGSGMASTFHVAVLAWTPGNGFRRTVLGSPDRSAAIRLAGSGHLSVKARLHPWQATEARDTTRVLFRGFADALAQQLDPLSGGAPQLVGLYRIGGGMSFGVLFEGKRYLHGMPVHALAPDSTLSWHNELFERVSGVTRKILPGAKRHGDVVIPPD